MTTNDSKSLDIQIQLLAIAYFYGDYSIVYNFVNKNSQIYKALLSKDFYALESLQDKIEIELSGLNQDDEQTYNKYRHEIDEKYRAQLAESPVPLPEKYFDELADRAIQLGNYTTAHSAFKTVDKLDKGVNQFVVKGVELLQSREVQSGGDDSDGNIARENIRRAAENFYKSIRIKNPLGNQFQYLSHDLFFKNHDALRKYYKYVELSLLKELVEFCVEYLIDDKSTSQKITAQLTSGKIRKQFLNYLARIFSNGDEKYQQFVDKYKKAVELLKNAKEEKDLVDIQKVLLGRGTGSNEYYQFLRELAIDHPISALLITIAAGQDNLTYLAPIILKSGVSIIEFLELDKTF